MRGRASAELYWEGKMVSKLGKTIEFLFCDWTMLWGWVFGDKESKKSVSRCIGKWMDEGALSCICIECGNWFEQEA